ncbi:MAG: ribosome-associated translation inhibitor RaiA [Simkaniaceae bacterium]|nr:ribosome-associated translation inhibitor RaiA [Simkaniaceae bacterium]
MAKPADNTNEYNTSIVGKNIEITNSMRDYVQERINKIEPFTPHILDILVKLDIQKLNHNVDIIVKFSHFKIKVHAVTLDMYSAIDKAFDKLRAKLSKWKDRIQDHHTKGLSATEVEVSIHEAEQDELEHMDEEIADANNATLKDSGYKIPSIVKTKKRLLKTLRLDEAMMKMELSDDNFLLFKSEEEQKLKVIYRTSDGNYGVIAAE